MVELFGPFVLFLGLLAASLGTLFFYARFPEHLQNAETLSTIRLVANLFTVLTSLLLGLMINSGKNTYESVDHNMHVFATDFIMLDRTLSHYGPDAAAARDSLMRYVSRAVATPMGDADRVSEGLLHKAGDGIDALKPTDTRHTGMARDAQQMFQRLVEMRWTLIEQAEGTIPMPLLFLMSAWLVMIFGSFGYLAPRNGVVITMFVLSALFVSCAIYLIVDMDSPYSGPISISRAPLARALAEMRS